MLWWTQWRKFESQLHTFTQLFPARQVLTSAVLAKCVTLGNPLDGRKTFYFTFYNDRFIILELKF